MIRNTLLAATMLFAFVSPAFADQLDTKNVLSEKESKALIAEVSAMIKGFHGGDSTALLKKTHPSLKKLMGGDEQFEKTMKNVVKQLLDSGMKFNEFEVKKPTKLYPAGDEQVCFVPQVTVMEVQGQKLKSVGFLIAIRPKAGGDWKYLDGAGLRNNPQMLQTLLPALDKSVQLPPNTIEPVK